MSFPTWTPLVPNGWHPRVWVDGPDIYVTYGFGQCWLSQLRFDGQILLQVRGARLDAAGGMSGHWIRPGVLTFWEEAPESGRDHWRRYEMDVRGPWMPTLVAGPSLDVGGNWMSASGGHFMERKPGVLRYDGTVVSTAAGATAQKAAWMTGAETWDNLVIRQWRNGTLLPARWQTVTPLHEIATGENGSFAYGGYGAIFGSHADDPNQQDLTVTPWRWEGTPFLWTRLTGEVWLATISWHQYDPQMGTLLRPWGAKDVVYVPVPAVHVHVDETPEYWFVATCGDTGAMTLSAVPTNTPRQILTTPRPPTEISVVRLPAIRSSVKTSGPHVLPTLPAVPESGFPILGDVMYSKATANLVSSNGFYNRFPADAPVGPGHPKMPADGTERGAEESEVTIRREPDGTYTLIAECPSKAQGREIILSCRDIEGTLELRYIEDRYADETWSVREEDGQGYEFAYNMHNKDGREFAPTLFTLDVLKAE